MATYAYNYKAKNRAKELVSGFIYASSQEDALKKIKSLGYQPADIPQINLRLSIDAFIHTEFNKKDLMIFYKTMGKRMDLGRSNVDGIESALTYVTDPKLVQSLHMVKNFLNEGMTFATALKNSGFPPRDVEILRATAEAGQQASTLARLADELNRNIKLERSIKSAFKQPIVMFVMMYVSFYGLLMFAAPKMIKFFSMMGIDFVKGKNIDKFPWIVKQYYILSNKFTTDTKFMSFIYFGIFIGIVLILRNKKLRSLFDKFKLVKEISIKSDLSNLWSSFALLYEAGANLEEICKMLSKAARRDDHRENFSDLARLIRSGIPLNRAVERAAFPEFLVTEVNAAVNSGELSDGLLDMSKGFVLDVEEKTEDLKAIIDLTMKLMMVLFVLLFFTVSYYPIIVVTMSKL